MTQILLIDDDEPVRAMLARMLTHFGHIVIEARNGKEGIEHFRASGADLVITDIVMPEMEGFEVLIELRKMGSPVKVIAMSGGGRQNPADVLRIASHLGAARVLAKPFSNELLMAAIKELVPEDAKDPPKIGALD
jgi:CheY-like chemotaxis protein